LSGQRNESQIAKILQNASRLLALRQQGLHLDAVERISNLFSCRRGGSQIRRNFAHTRKTFCDLPYLFIEIGIISKDANTDWW
jgi:hypothetical protein